jgi:membrane-associated phospholipid phosphatase
MMYYLARLISFIFHPLLMITYMLVILLSVNPFLFGVNSLTEASSRLLILQVFLSSFFIPGMAVAMLRFTGLVKSIELPDKQDRIGPYIISGIFYLWLFRNLLSNTLIPNIYSSFVLGATIALFLAFFINIFSKISAHSTGMGGLVAMIIITMTFFPEYPTFTLPWFNGESLQITLSALLIIGIVLSGLVGVSRLMLEAHEPKDLYGGYLIGFIAQFIALRFVM